MEEFDCPISVPELHYRGSQNFGSVSGTTAFDNPTCKTKQHLSSDVIYKKLSVQDFTKEDYVQN